MKNRYDFFNLFFSAKYFSVFFILLSTILQLTITSDIFAQSPRRTRLYTHPQNFDRYDKTFEGYVDANFKGYVFIADTYIPVPNAEVNIFYEQYWIFESWDSVPPIYMFILEGATFPWQGWLFSSERGDPLPVNTSSNGYYVFGNGSFSNDIYLNYTGPQLSISGIVVDSTQTPIPEVNIELRTGTYEVATVLTDSDGNFLLSNLYPSNYALISTKENYIFDPDSIFIELRENDISGITITGKPVKPFQVWVLPKDPFAPKYHKTGVIPADIIYPAKVFAKMENDIGEPIENHPITFTLQNPEFGELRLDNSVEQETITVPTDEDGIASVYYHFTGHINKSKIVEQIVIHDQISGNEGIVNVEIGLGLKINNVERYETEAGLIVPGTQIGMVVEIESSENFQTDKFDIEAYLDSVRSEGIWDDAFGVNLNIKWINKQKPSLYGKLVNLFWNTEDEVYNGFCGFDNLRDLNTNYDFNILYAYGNPKTEYGNLHSLPAVIPHSIGNHLYEISASISTNSNQGEYVRIDSPFMQINVNGVSSEIELFLCAFSPTTKTQFVVAEIFKNYNQWGGAALDLIDISCKIFEGKFWDAILNIAKYKGDAYLGSLKDKIGESDFLQNLSEKELAEVYKAILFKDAADFYNYIAGIQGLDSLYNINKPPQNKTTNLMLPPPDVSDMEYQNLANINIIGMLQNEENLNSRIIAVVNADEVNLKNSSGDFAKEIDYDFENIDDMMKTTVDNVTCFILTGNDSYTLDLITNQNTSLSTCRAGETEYNLAILETSQNTSGTLEVTSSGIGNLNIDYNSDGTVDDVIIFERINPFDSSGGGGGGGSASFLDSLISTRGNGNTEKRIYSYNSSGKRSSYIFEEWNGNQLLSRSKTSYTYNSEGKKTLELQEEWNENQWNNSKRYNYTYDANGNITLQLREEWNGNQWINSQRYNHTYDANGYKTLELREVWDENRWNISRRINYTNDAYGNKTFELWEIWNGNQWNNYYRYNYIYDSNGNITLDSREDWDENQWIKIWRHSYTYDSNNNRISELSEISRGDENQWSNSQLSTYIYDSFNNLSSKFTENWEDGSWINAYINSYTYDINNNKTSRLYQVWDNNMWNSYFQNNFTYNSNNDMVFASNEIFSSAIDKYTETAFSFSDVQGNLYNLQGVRIEGFYSIITGIDEAYEYIPSDYYLSQNYPNPFNPTTTIKFGLPERGFVDLRVYNILGQEVARLVNKELAPGYHEVNFGQNNIASGIYIYRIDVKGKFNSVKKMLMIK